MPTQSSSPEIINRLADIVGEENVLRGGEALADYSRDMADFEAAPMAVVRPGSEGEVARVVRLANRRRIPVVARGAGSSLTGAVVAEGAIILDLRRLNRVIRVDPVNWHVHVQAGVVLDDLNSALKPYGFFFPPDPASSFLCTVGGAIAEGSGGMRCVRYGTMRDWVLALRVVLANGKAAWLGEPLAKNRAGYDLVHLFVGSEGTLGIVTEAYLKILPLPAEPIRRMLVLFDDWQAAGRAIMELRRSRVAASLMEFMDRETVAAVNRELQLNLKEAEALLLVDVGEAAAPRAAEVLRASGASEVVVARDEEEAERLYQARGWAYIAVKNLATGVQVEDVAVPIDRLAEYLTVVREVAARFGLRVPVVGHAGDGNVHPIILYDRSDPGSRAAAQAAFEELCRYAIRVGGTVTGEHGVGVQKARLFREQLAAHGGGEALKLMRRIKRAFDPNGILNPGKYVEAACRFEKLEKGRPPTQNVG